MADFPTTVFPEFKAREVWRDPLLKDYSRSGAFRGRRLAAAKKRRLAVPFKRLTNAERTTIETHYDAHRVLTFNFAWPDAPGTVYIVAYADDDGLDWEKESPGRWNVNILFEEA